MFKKYFYLLFLFLLSNCSAPGTALLGPVFTGAKTGSIYQATLSYSTGRIMNEVKESHSFLKSDSIINNEPFINNDPIIILSYAVDIVEISNVIEPEPLP